MPGVAFILLSFFWTTQFGDSLSDEHVYRDFEDDGIVNVNSATFEQLMMVPNMTPGLASCIVDRRPFRDSDELKNRCGVSDWYIHQLEPYLAFTGDVRLRLRLKMSSATQKGYGSVWLGMGRISGGAGMSGYGRNFYYFLTLSMPHRFFVTVGRLRPEFSFTRNSFWRPSTYGAPSIAIQKYGLISIFLSESTRILVMGNRLGGGVSETVGNPRRYFAFGRIENERFSLGVMAYRDTSWGIALWMRSRFDGAYSNFMASSDFERNRLYLSLYPRESPILVGVYIGGYTRIRATWRVSRGNYVRIMAYMSTNSRGVRAEYESRKWLRFFLRTELIYDDGRSSILSARLEKNHVGLLTYVYSLGDRSYTYWEPDGTPFPISGCGSRTAIYGFVKLRWLGLSWKIGYSSSQKADFSVGLRYSNVNY